MLYGYGSKKRLIEEFRKKICSNYNCVVINGFFPSVTLKNVSLIYVINVSAIHVNVSVFISLLYLVTMISFEQNSCLFRIHVSNGINCGSAYTWPLLCLAPFIGFTSASDRLTKRLESYTCSLFQFLFAMR